MKIAFLGTRGIPNNYGGFEQFAENLSVRLAKRGHQVNVYNPHYHYYKDEFYNNVKIIRKYDPEKYIGAAANYIYDYLCLRHALKQKFDVIIECGAASVALAYMICRIKGKLIFTNPDGMEGKRQKWSFVTKKIINISEKIAIKKSPFIITDHPEINTFIRSYYKTNATYIPYGAEIPKNYNDKLLEKFNVSPNKYLLIISRIIPENNIKILIDGYLQSDEEQPLLIIGLTKTRYGEYLKRMYSKKKNVRFLGSIYNQELLDNLRYFSKIYFHGHSVGGTNPSLLEAMACSCYIIAHNNKFNKGVLNNGADYFISDADIKGLIQEYSENMNINNYVKINLDNINSNYKWDLIVDRYEKVLMECQNIKG